MTGNVIPPACADLGPELSRRLADVIQQEIHRVGFDERAVSPEVLLLARRVAMRSAHEGTAQLAAELQHHGIEIHLAASLIDEAGENLLVPPLES